MQKQIEITGGGPLLDKNGVLIRRGYAVKAVLEYRRSAIKAPPWRIKENMLFYGGEAFKISEVRFDLAEGGYMSPKHFSSDDGSFEMDFTPVYDRYTENKILFVDTRCHQIFGRFTGKARIGGKELKIKDLTAFTEHAVNNW